MCKCEIRFSICKFLFIHNSELFVTEKETVVVLCFMFVRLAACDSRISSLLEDMRFECEHLLLNSLKKIKEF